MVQFCSMHSCCMHSCTEYVHLYRTCRWINHPISFLIDKIACLAVPSFFMCSGYLFYRNFTWEKISVKLKRRFFSLVVPFLLWNLLYYILHLVARKIPYVSQLFDTDVPFSLKELADAVFLYKYNPVFWFMSYLIIFSFFMSCHLRDFETEVGRIVSSPICYSL